jgi:ribonuclease P protein component
MTKREVREVIRTGQRVQTPLVTIYLKRLSPRPARPVAMVVSKKIARHATARHRLQRWLREAGRQVRDGKESALAMVWIARPQLARVGHWHEVVDSLEPYRGTLGGLVRKKSNL